jgi:hypothetical protein
MGEENAVAGEMAASAAAAGVLAGRWAMGLGSALALLMAGVEGAHGLAERHRVDFEQIIQEPAPISTPASHPDISAPDPGDNP